MHIFVTNGKQNGWQNGHYCHICERLPGTSFPLKPEKKATRERNGRNLGFNWNLTFLRFALSAVFTLGIGHTIPRTLQLGWFQIGEWERWGNDNGEGNPDWWFRGDSVPRIFTGSSSWMGTWFIQMFFENEKRTLFFVVCRAFLSSACFLCQFPANYSRSGWSRSIWWWKSGWVVHGFLVNALWRG